MTLESGELTTSATSKACDLVADRIEEALAGVEEDRDDHHVQLVDQPGLDVLADRGGAAAEADVLAAGGRERLLVAPTRCRR